MAGRARYLLPCLLAGLCGCDLTHEALRCAIPPEQRILTAHDPAQLPPVSVPPLPPPRTVSDPRPDTPAWELSLDEAIRVGLENAKVVRVLAGVAAANSGSTVYDAAIANTLIDQQQARFDPAFTNTATWNHTDQPQASLLPFDPTRAVIGGLSSDNFNNQLGLTKTNVLGGQWGLTWNQNPTRFVGPGSEFVPLNPQNRGALDLTYSQPLLQGAGFYVNLAPVVIARLDTERSFFQYKDSVQELVRGVIEAYWNLVFARTEVWARGIQVDEAQAAYERALARKQFQLTDIRDVAQARVTLSQFRAALIAARADALTREGALRNVLGLPPEDDRLIVPVSAPTDRRLGPDWPTVSRLAEERRPDVVELKLVLEADGQRLLQAHSQALPQLNATGMYRWNGLTGTAPDGEHLGSGAGQFTEWSMGLNFSVPLGLRQGRALVRQSDLVIARDRANLEQAVHAALHQVTLTARDIDNDYEQYRAFKDTRAAALENVQVQIAEFRAGRSIYLNVLQALNDWGNSVLSESQSLVSYNVALATLERQTGTILETHGLVFFEERFRAAGPCGYLGDGRCYPWSLKPVGEPQRYPSTGEPGENSFDLSKPELRPPQVGEPEPLPPPPGKGP
jgi:outer membrane protein TolC